jgi:putative tricarboxylic transport membrane protein
MVVEDTSVTSDGDILIMLVFGWLGYLMKKYRYEAAPLVLAFILGPLMETNLRRSLIISRGKFDMFLTRPISLTCLLIACLFLLFPLIPFMKKKKEKIIKEEMT